MYLLKRNPDPRQKPPLGSVLNPDHPLSQGLVGCWLMNEGSGGNAYDLSRVLQYGTLTDNATWANTVDGSGLKFPTDNGTDRLNLGSITSDNPLSGYPSQAICVAAKFYKVAQADRTNNYARIIDKSDGGNVLDGWGINLNYIDSPIGAFNFGIDNDTSGSKLTSNGHPEAGIFSLVMGRTSSATSGIVYINGKSDIYQKNGFDSFSSITTNAAIGNWNHDIDRQWDGLIEYVYVYDQLLTEGLALQLHAEPYTNILVPQYWYMVDFGAAGQTGSLSDIFSLNEVFSPKASLKASLSDSLSLSESQSPIAHLIASLADAASFSEAKSALAHLKSSLSDSMNLSDSITAVASLSGTISDTLTLTDNVSAVLAAIATLSDVLNLSDSLTYKGKQLASLSDTLTFSDSQSAKANLLAALSDVFSLTDTQSALAALKSILTDTLNLSDELTTQMIGNLTDALAFSDSIEAVASFLASIIDVISLSDSTVAKVHLKVSLSDTLTLSEQLSSLAAYAISLIDTLALSDVVNGITVTAKGEVTITFSSKGLLITFSSKGPSNNFFS